MDDRPDPPIAPDVDLKDFPFTPLYRARLFGSAFHARATDTEWRAGLTLWLKSQDQVPAGSLPDDDVELCRLAELGRDIRIWRKIRNGALHGWHRCNDGRLYHPVVAEIVNEQWTGKLRRKWMNDCGRAKKAAQRRNLKIDLPTFEEWLSQGQRVDVQTTDPRHPGDSDDVSPDLSPTSSLGQSGDVPRENPSNRKGQGQGQGKGEGDSNNPDASASGEGASAPAPARERSNGSSRKGRLPADWWPDRTDCRYASNRGHDDGWVGEQADAFRDYHTAACTRYADWHAAWRTWVRRAEEFAARDARRANGAVGRDQSQSGGVAAAMRAVLSRGDVD